MTDSKVHPWVQTRQMGQSAFVWKYGVACWGLMTALAWSVLMACQNGDPRSLISLLPIALVVFLAGGYAFGRVMWWLGERHYQRSQSHNLPAAR